MKPIPKPGKRKKRKRKVRTAEQIEYDELLKYNDNLWKELVLKRDKNYDHYRQKPANQAHHIMSRSYFPTRWLLLNGISLSQGTHRYDAHGRGSADFTEWIRSKWMGEEQYISLLRRKNNRMKRNVETLRAVKISLEQQRGLGRESD